MRHKRNTVIHTILLLDYYYYVPRIQHDVAKILVALLVIERIFFPRQKVDPPIQFVAIAGHKIAIRIGRARRFVNEFAKIGDAGSGIFQQTQPTVGDFSQNTNPTPDGFRIGF